MYRVMLAALVAFVPTLILAADTLEVTELATLNVVTVPGYAEIKVNSETIGFAPIRDLAMPSGEYVISAFFDENEPIEKNITLTPGDATDVWFYATEGAGRSWFRTRDFLIGVGVFWGVIGLYVAIIFNTGDWD
jgi:hypothetical protein